MTRLLDPTTLYRAHRFRGGYHEHCTRCGWRKPKHHYLCLVPIVELALAEISDLRKKVAEQEKTP